MEMIDSLIRKTAAVTISYADTNVYINGEPKPVSDKNTHHYCVTHKKDLVLVKSNLFGKNGKNDTERILWFYFFDKNLVKVEFRYIVNDKIEVDIHYYYNQNSLIKLTRESGKGRYSKIVRNQKKNNLLVAAGLLDKFSTTIYKRIHW